MAHQVLDANADIALAPQPQPFAGVTVEPEDFMIGPEQHRAFGHRAGEATKLAQQAR